MALSVNGGGLPGRNQRSHGTLSDINITPFVDVLLVLLIIFMLTAHVMEFGIEVDVPKVRQVRDSAQELPVVSITRDGNLFLNEKPVNINELPAEVKRRFSQAEQVYLRADKNTPWDPIAQVMSELNRAQIKINAVTQPEDEAERKRR
ncbi:MAG: biopolymer transporter ExbD [Bryobacterales bacterium]|nr:biopolymer transporter ExbD [Bryobacterales bacterium]